MTQKKVAEIDKLYHEVLAYNDTAEFKELLQFIKKFRNIAPFNAMLIHIQKPGSCYVASAGEWEKKFNRHVKPGARPLVILKPFAPVTFVYEYNDTEGDPLPTEIVSPFEITAAINEWDLRNLINSIKGEGIGAEERDYGTQTAGKIQWHDEEYTLEMEMLRKTHLMKSHHTIIYNKNLSDTAKYTTILHELGHLYCGHLYHDPKVYSWLPERHSIGLTDQQEEFEAETVSWLVCERLGIENPSEKYLADYLDNNRKIPAVSIDTILKAVGIIESLVMQIKKPRQELTLKIIDQDSDD